MGRFLLQAQGNLFSKKIPFSQLIIFWHLSVCQKLSSEMQEKKNQFFRTDSLCDAGTPKSFTFVQSELSSAGFQVTGS